MAEAHVYMTPEIEAQLPALGATDGNPDKVAQVKLFTPDANWTWYLLEYDPHERLCFGLVQGLEEELGYFSLAELEGVRGPLGLRIERDLYFDPTPLDRLRTQSTERS